ncbi:MAG: adenylate/guanylate cyclase domain-containing protein [Pseudomonadota bacterium]
MECPRCRAENPPGHRFCSACGHKLARGCAHCGFDNPAEARFCGGCGQALTTPPGAAGPDIAAAPTEGERRPVAILFADLVGFTELSTRLDAEDLKRLVERFYGCVDAAIGDHGGTVDKHIGDAVMALFGAPVAHGDDPLRAVRTALAIHRRLAEGDPAQGALRAHIGIAAGEVVAGGLAGGYTVLGESVNLAARLVEVAGSGETVIAEDLRQALGSRVAVTALPARPLKGIGGPVKAWRVEGLIEAAMPATPFVGRVQDRRLLSGMVAATLAGGRGRLVVLRGEAGIGKSRLLEETAAEAERQGFAPHKASVLDFGAGKGQDAVPVLMQSLLGLGPGSDEPARLAAVEQARRDGLIEAGELAPLEDLLALPSEGERRLIYEAMDNATRLSRKQSLVAALIRRLAVRRPLCLAIEDLHWADPTTLAYVAAAAEATAGASALLLVTTRPEGDPLDRAWRAGLVEAEVSTLDLAPLRADEATELAAAIMAPGDDRIAACIARAQGNPLFLEQLLRHTASAAAEAVPTSIQSVVLGRVDRLAPEHKAALQAAAVLGQRFAPAALAHLLDRPRAEVASLIEARLLKPDGADLAFVHALIRDGVYASLLKSRRHALHRKAAAWFHGRDAVLEAEHLDRAQDPGAAAAYLAAATAHMAQFQFERARMLARRGLELAQEPGLRGSLAAVVGEVAQGLGDTQGALEAFRLAAELLPAGPERMAAVLGVANGLSVLDRLDEALALLDEAQAEAERLGLTVVRARIHGLRGNILFPRSELDRCLAEHARALELAVAAGAVEEEARAHGGLGDAHYLRGDVRRFFEHFDRCVTLARKHGFRRIEVANQPMRALAAMFKMDFAASLEDAEAAVALARQVGHRRAEMIAEHMRFWDLMELGELDGARNAAECALAISRLLGARRFEAEGLMFLGQVHCVKAEGSGLGVLREAIAIARETPSYMLPAALGVLASETDDPQERRAALAEGEALLAAGAVWHNHTVFNRNALEAALRSGDPEAAERYAAALEQAAVSPVPYLDFLAARGRALARWLRGRGDKAELEQLLRLAAAQRWRAVMPAMEAALAS